MDDEDFLRYLKQKYGDHEYNYPDLSAYNLSTLIKHKDPKNYEEFDKYASELQKKVAYIHKFQKKRKLSES